MALNVVAPVDPIAPEIIWFAPSEQFLHRPHQLLSVVKKGSTGSGMLRNYYGRQLDNPDIRVWIMVWQTLAHHRSFMEHEAYVDVILPVMEAMVGPGEITQVLLSNPSEFDRALSSPVTQFIYITVRPLHDRRYELGPLIERVKRELKHIQGCLASCWGPSVEQDRVQVGVVGWRRIQDRDTAVNGPLAQLRKLVRELGSIEIKYAKLSIHR